jgi:plasmid stability protein
MPDILIRGVPSGVVESLKRKAARGGRSLQQELRFTLERIAVEDTIDLAEAAERVRRRLTAKHGPFSDSTPLIREDRDR